MDGDSRREEIMKLLGKECAPVSGAELSKRLGVSRQVIVQDIALLRAVNKNILSTNKGYILFSGIQQEMRVKKTFHVKHGEEDILSELYTIADFGGKVLDVVVEHPVYGQITVDLIINSRADADSFLKQVRENRTKPLNELTEGVHYHTVEADSAEQLERIEKALDEKGYLIK